MLVSIADLDNGELGKTTDNSLGISVATSGENCGLVERSFPPLVVEGIRMLIPVFLSFPIAENQIIKITSGLSNKARIPGNGAIKYLDTHKCRGSLKSSLGSINPNL
jgi:hypothetical protein